jgi:hypothetical protein
MVAAYCCGMPIAKWSCCMNNDRFLNKDEVQAFYDAHNLSGGIELIDSTIESLVVKINDHSDKLDRLFFYYSFFALFVLLISLGVIDLEKVEFLSIRSKSDLIILSPAIYVILFLQYSYVLYYDLRDRYYFDILNMIKNKDLFQSGLHNKRLKYFILLCIFVFAVSFGLEFLILYCYHSNIKANNLGNEWAFTSANFFIFVLIFIVVFCRFKKLSTYF